MTQRSFSAPISPNRVNLERYGAEKVRPELEKQLTFPELVDIATAASLLTVNVRKVRRMVAGREIEFVRIGRRLRFDLAVLRAWIDARRVPPKAAGAGA